MITLIPRPARTTYDGPKNQLKVMFKVLRVKDKNAKWRAHMLLRRTAYFKGWDNRSERIEQIQNSMQYIKFYDQRSSTFQTGLLSRVTKFLEKKKIPFKIELPKNHKDFPKFNSISKFKFTDSVENRKEQVDATNIALQKGRGIIHAATNAGKTEIACAIISEFNRQTGRVPRVLFLIHRAGLVQQTVDRFRKHLPNVIRVSMLGAGQRSVPKGRAVIVSTVQTASRILQEARFREFQEACDILFIDEFHLNKAWACSKITKLNAAPFRIGLSGTIDKDNKTKMLHYEGMTGPIIFEIRNKELVNMGRSAKPIITFREFQTEEIPRKVGFAKSYRLGIVKNKNRNKIIVQDTIKHLEKERKTLLTVARISHGILLKRRLEKKIDLRVEFLSGKDPIYRRQQVIKQFEKGKVGVLIASPIFDTGVDIPSIEGWVNAAGGKGWELVLQRLGRVLRKKKGENVVYINDYIDKHNPYLFEHSLGRIKHYTKEQIGELKIVGGRDV